MKRKGLLWLTVLKVSFRGWLAVLLLGLWQGSTSWQEGVAGGNSWPPGWDIKEKEKGAEVPQYPQGHILSDQGLPSRSYIFMFLPPPNSAAPNRSNLCHVDLWETLRIQTAALSDTLCQPCEVSEWASWPSPIVQPPDVSGRTPSSLCVIQSAGNDLLV